MNVTNLSNKNQNGGGPIAGSLLFIFFIRGELARYHYEKPTTYCSAYGTTYLCDHPVYSKCTLFEMSGKGLAIIQQRFDPETKKTWWSEIDPWLTDSIYLHRGFKQFFAKNTYSFMRNNNE